MLLDIFPLTAFTILSLCIWLFDYYVIGGTSFFWSRLFAVLLASCMFVGISFFRLERFSSIILLKIFAGPLSWQSSLSSIPIIHSFGLFIMFWISWMYWVRIFLNFAFFDCYINIFFLFSFSFNFLYLFLLDICFIYITNGIPFLCYSSKNPLSPSSPLVHPIPNFLTCIPLSWGIEFHSTNILSSYWCLQWSCSATYVAGALGPSMCTHWLLV